MIFLAEFFQIARSKHIIKFKGEGKKYQHPIQTKGKNVFRFQY